MVDVWLPVLVALMYGTGDYLLKLSSDNVSRASFLLSMGIGVIFFLPFVLQAKGLLIYMLALLWIVGEAFFYEAAIRERVSIIAPLTMTLQALTASIISLGMGWEGLTLFKIIGGILSIAALFATTWKGKMASMGAIVYIILTGITWGIEYPFLKGTLEAGNSPPTIIGVVSLSYILYGILSSLWERSKIKVEKNAVLAGFLIIGALIPLTESIKRVGIMITSFVASLSPVATIVLGVWGGERLSLREWIGIALAMLSIVAFSL